MHSACYGCRFTQNSINGIYCTRLRRYVQYTNVQPCTNIINPQNP